MTPNRLIDGRYRILEHIGSGGMATVYAAMDEYLDRKVAIKFLRLNTESDDKNLERFRREAYSIAELNHPNIVEIYDIGDNDDGNYIVMEYIDGINLKEYIRLNAPLSAREVQSILAQILSGMQQAHEHYVIHRDLKPQNIMIKADGTVKVMDFGIAVISTETAITQTNTIVGSVHYLSPEQARGGNATPRSDIYALGIVGYEMLTGHVPFDGESAVSIAVQHFQEPLPSINAERDDIPNALQNVIYKATEKDPDDRYQSCREMLDDLRTALDPERANEPLHQQGGVSEATAVLAKEDIKAQLADEPLPEREEPAVRREPDWDERDKEAEDERQAAAPKQGSHLFRNIVIALVILIPLLFLVYMLLPKPASAQVPDLRDTTQAEARRLLSDEGFELGAIDRQYSSEIEKERVIDTEPKRGTIAKKGTRVDLLVSDGEEPQAVPNVVGKTYDQAKRELEELGFHVNRDEEHNDEAETDEVIRQSITEGTTVLPSETTITLTVSLGEESFALADLSNYTRVEVQQYVDQHQLIVSFNEEHSDDVEEGRVINQSIAANTPVKANTRLTVTLSSGPEEKDEEPKEDQTDEEEPELKRFTYDVTVAFDDSEGQEENTVEIYIADKNHSFDEPADTFTITEDKAYRLHFVTEGDEPAQYRIVRNDAIIAEEQVVADDES